MLLDHSIVCNVWQCTFVTPGSQKEAFVQFNFVYSPIYLTAYTLRTRTDDLSEAFPRTWKVEGSYDNISWFEVDEQIDSDKLSHLSAEYTFPCKNPALLKHMKITLTQANWGIPQEIYRFHLSRVDFFW